MTSNSLADALFAVGHLSGKDLDVAMKALFKGGFAKRRDCRAAYVPLDGDEATKRERLKRLVGICLYSGHEKYLKENMDPQVVFQLQHSCD